MKRYLAPSEVRAFSIWSAFLVHEVVDAHPIETSMMPPIGKEASVEDDHDNTLDYFAIEAFNDAVSLRDMGL